MTTVRSLRLVQLPLFLAALLAGCWGGPERPESDPTSHRSPPAGDVVGFTNAYGSHAWRGVPYARAPEGALRWRAPRPVPPWKGTHEALEPGQPCSQFASVYAGGGRWAEGKVGAEDCLYLDVWAPRVDTDSVPTGSARLPVMFWIHGGGDTIGSAGFYDGGNLAATQRVVVVVINYRLGPFGWFRHASLRGDEGATAADRSGNFGTLDMIRALQWVQENISAFGGDPDRVTIFGESAGGASVASLLLSPQARGLFHRAIMQSAGTDFSSAQSAENFSDDAGRGDEHSSNEILLRLLIAEGAAPDRAAARARLAAMTDAELARYLRAKSNWELLAAYASEDFEGMYPVPVRIADGTVLPDDEPMARFKRGAYNRVPVLMGTNRDENKIFMLFDPSLVRWRLGLLPVALDPVLYEARSEHQANAWKARSVDELASVLRRVQGPTVYAYRWDWDEEPGFLLYDAPALIGAAHGLEIAFVFGHWNLGPDSGRLFTSWNRAGREALAEQMMSYWAEFAYKGAPGQGRRGDLPDWPAWDDSSDEAPKYVVLDTPDDGGVRLASETWTIDKVVAAIAADPRLATVRDKCGLLRGLAGWGYVTKEQYAQTNGALCSHYAFDEYPWAEVAARE